MCRAGYADGIPCFVTYPKGICTLGDMTLVTIGYVLQEHRDYIISMAWSNVTQLYLFLIPFKR